MRGNVAVSVAVAAVASAAFYVFADDRLISFVVSREGVAALLGATVFAVGLVVAVHLDKTAQRRRLVRNDGKVGRGTRPDFVFDEVGIRYEGLLWKGVYGADYPDADRDEMRPYVEGPYCPEDNTRLTERHDVRTFLPDREYWKCSRCGNGYTKSGHNVIEEVERGVVSAVEEEFSDEVYEV